MKSNLLNIAIAIALFLFSSCQKENGLSHPPEDKSTPPFLLDKVEYKDLQLTSYFVYNNDSTVKQIVHANTSSGASVEYTYNNKLLTKTEVPGSFYITNYGYTHGLLTTITGTQQGQGVIGYKLEYQYASGGVLNKLLHYKLDEAGQHLQTTITYQYNTQGLPEKATSTQANGAILTWTLENYSDVCYLEAKAFVTGHSLDELYAIYNFPILNKINRFPQKITLTLQQAQQSPKVQQIYENTCTITNKKLEKINARITFPDFPQYNTSEELSFFYK